MSGANTPYEQIMKLSIITINYNNLAGLRRTIDSVLAQTWHDFEWIVIDGGSTDGSRELIEQYQEHFAYWCSEKDRGVYHAQNKGIGYANGLYLLFLNSGDCLYSESTLSDVFTRIGESNKDVYYGNWNRMENDGSITFCQAHKVLTLDKLIRQNICHQAMFIKRDCLKGGYDENYRILADWCKWVELALNGSEFVYLDLIVCDFDCSGLSEKNAKQAEQEHSRIVASLPKVISDTIDYLYETESRLSMYQNSQIARKVLQYVYKKRLYSRILSVNLRIISLTDKLF